MSDFFNATPLLPNAGGFCTKGLKNHWPITVIDRKEKTRIWIYLSVCSYNTGLNDAGYYLYKSNFDYLTTTYPCYTFQQDNNESETILSNIPDDIFLCVGEHGRGADIWARIDAESAMPIKTCLADLLELLNYPCLDEDRWSLAEYEARMDVWEGAVSAICNSLAYDARPSLLRWLKRAGVNIESAETIYDSLRFLWYDSPKADELLREWEESAEGEPSGPYFYLSADTEEAMARVLYKILGRRVIETMTTWRKLWLPLPDLPINTVQI